VVAFLWNGWSPSTGTSGRLRRIPHVENLLALYEPEAVLRVDASQNNLTGLAAIASELQHMLQAPGTMTSRNNFCIIHGDLALRADWDLVADDGSVVASGSSAEIVRRQTDGTWRYVIDHAAGAGLPRVG
jgi:ketosteroid isomerase-like protein